MGRVRCKDYRGLKSLNSEQQQQLHAARKTTHAYLQQSAAVPEGTTASVNIPTATFSNGRTIPLIGLGTWKSSPGQAHAAVSAAVRCGYRHIDCASIYGNEHEIGAALAELFAEGTVQREELFITTKLWNSDHNNVEAACRRSLAALHLTYLDLYLTHWPVVTGCTGPTLVPSTAETWSAMEGLVRQGLVRSIGLSNFSRVKLQQLMDSPTLTIKPAVLQVEAHPYWPNTALIDWAQQQGIHVTAYSPLGSPDSAQMLGRDPAKSGSSSSKGVAAAAAAEGLTGQQPQLMQHPLVLDMAKRHRKSTAQVLIRWSIQKGTSVIPKSANPERIKANLDVFSWSLSDADMTALARLAEVASQRMVDGSFWLSPEGPYRRLEDLWDAAVPDREVLRQQVIARYTNINTPQPHATLNTGSTIPLLGLGTWKSQPGAVRAAVLAAVRCGYRHIDCAAIYGNEQEVGAALAELLTEGVVTREQLFITSKLWNTHHAPAMVPQALQNTLADLGLTYLDLYLIHWPVVTGCTGPTLVPSTAETWSAMEGLVRQGLVRSIGLSNFSRVKLQQLMDSPTLTIKPAVLQVEAHPYWPNTILIDWAQQQGIHVTAYSPLGSPDSASIMRRGKESRRLMEDAQVLAVAGKYNKSPAQVLIRWALERGTSCLPKSANEGRIAANFQVLDWQLDPADTTTLSNLKHRERMVTGIMWLDARGPYKSVSELWNDEKEQAVGS